MAESFSDKINNLLHGPKGVILEDDSYNEDTHARVTSEKVEDFDNDERSFSKLRKKNASLLDDTDERYQGSFTKRSDVFDNDNFGSSEDISDASDEALQPHIENNSRKRKRDIEDGSDISECDNSSGDFRDYNDEKTSDEEDGEEYLDINDDEAKSISNSITILNTSDKINKGISVRNQLVTWENLMEVLIQLQKGITAANKLPSFSVFKEIKEQENQEFNEAIEKNKAALITLLNKLLRLQSVLIKTYPETKNLLGNNKIDKVADSDEEIPSDTEDEDTNEFEKENTNKKMKLNEINSEINKRFNLYKKYRSSVIQKWNDKTNRLDVSNNSINDQISHILNNDMDKLIKHSQQKHSNYDIIGEDAVNSNEDDSSLAYNTNIFDDSDFYHNLLRELIAAKSADITDPILLGQQWIKLQNMRNKIKKKKDTGATKGRKIKYVVHPKLVSFIPIVNIPECEERFQTDLFKNIFRD